MADRSTSRRRLAMAVLGGMTLSGALLAGATVIGAVQGPTLVRGNAHGEWRYWGADAWSTRYSPLDQINASNFDSLQVAWQWNAGSLGSDEYYRTTPLYAKGRIFTVATTRRVAAAIDPEKGETLWMWRLDEGIRWQKAPRQFAGRGLAYWNSGTEERVIVVTPGYHMASLDARTGIPDPTFGRNGVVDLMSGLGFPLVPLAVDDTGSLIISDAAPARRARPGEKWDPVTKTGADGTVGIDPVHGQIANSSPAIVVGDVIVVGNSSIHGYYPIRVRNLPGFIRGFDIRTGRQLWKFNLVPQPGEFGAETWERGSKIGSEGVGKNDAWATYSADPELGLVYIPVGMPLMDEYGGHRPGNNLYGNSLVALDAKTGKRKWHYQMVHHDIWDYDTPMSPNLMDITVNGQRRKVIAQSTKQGWVYTFDRATGEPIWPMPETPVLQSDVPGEKTSPTQPIPSKPAPYAQQGLVESDLIDYTPAIRDSALKIAKRCRMGPYYIPPSTSDGKGANGFTCSWYAPGAAGGVNIDGGAAVDPETGMLYVASQSPLSTTMLTKDPCSEFRYSSPHDACGTLGALAPPEGYERPGVGGRGGRGGAGFEGRAGNSTIGGVSIVKPKPYGGITAYDMNSGDKAWWIPNGGPIPVASTDAMFAGVTLPPASGRGLAQVITTKSLVIYGTGRSGGPPGSTPQLYAVEKSTGRQLGAVTIPARTSAVPMTYMHQGRQYIVFASGAGANTVLTALTLPRSAAAGGRGDPSPAQAVVPQPQGAAGVQPTNDHPNRHQTIEGWAKLPQGRTWGSTSAVDIDRDGTSIWVAERCGVNSCRDSANVDPIMKFDATGKMVKSFGRGLFNFPHGIHVDRDGNIWVTDGQNNVAAGRGGRGGAAAGIAPATSPAPTKGMQVYKFSPDGALLMTLGKPGGSMPGPVTMVDGAVASGYFHQPNDVLVLPNGEILVAEGHGGDNARILRFAKDGRYIESWGRKGTGPLEFDQPHALAMDSRGRIFVGDRSNNRIQILDQSGKLLDTWYQFSRPSGIYIDRDDNIYVADSESGSVAPARTEWKRGIRIGSARDGRLTGFIPDPEAAPRSTSSAEGVAVDANGVVYGAEVGQRAVKRYTPR